MHAAALERRLERLIGLLETADAPAERLAEALRGCGEGFAALRAAEASAPLERARRARLVRLQALASSLASTQAEDLSARLERVRGARRHLAALRDEPAAGGSCDVAG